MVQRLVVRTVSLTTDMGTELALQRVPTLDAGQLHPHWREAAGMVDDLPGIKN